MPRKGWKPSPETIQRLIDSHTGLKDSDETKARKSAAAKGRPKSPEQNIAASIRLKGIRPSDACIAAATEAAKIRMQDPVFRQMMVERSHSPEAIIKRILTQKANNKPRSEEAKELQRIAMLRHMIEAPADCRCAAHSFHNRPSKIETIIWDFVFPDLPKTANKRFGKYRVDIYIGKPWHFAAEADGDYWHNLPGAKEYDAERDAFLLREFDLPVIRYTETELNEIGQKEYHKYLASFTQEDFAKMAVNQELHKQVKEMIAAGYTT